MEEPGPSASDYPTPNTHYMQGTKLEAALRRMASDSVLTLLPPEGIKTADRPREIRVSEALLMVARRDDFRGSGTGRKVRSIRLVVQSKPNPWTACWQNTAAACTRFHADQRSFV